MARNAGSSNGHVFQNVATVSMCVVSRANRAYCFRSSKKSVSMAAANKDAIYFSSRSSSLRASRMLRSLPGPAQRQS